MYLCTSGYFKNESFWKHDTKWKKPNTKAQRVYDLITKGWIHNDHEEELEPIVS